MALSLCRTERLRSIWPGMIKVRPMYRFLIKPSRYFTPSLYASGRRRGAAGIRDGDHHIDIVARPLTQDLVGQTFAHPQTGLVHRDIVDDRIGRARYTNSKMHGEYTGFAAHCR